MEGAQTLQVGEGQRPDQVDGVSGQGQVHQSRHVDKVVPAHFHDEVVRQAQLHRAAVHVRRDEQQAFVGAERAERLRQVAAHAVERAGGDHAPRLPCSNQRRQQAACDQGQPVERRGRVWEGPSAGPGAGAGDEMGGERQREEQEWAEQSEPGEGWRGGAGVALRPSFRAEACDGHVGLSAGSEGWGDRHGRTPGDPQTWGGGVERCGLTRPLVRNTCNNHCWQTGPTEIYSPSRNLLLLSRPRCLSPRPGNLFTPLAYCLATTSLEIKDSCSPQ